MSATNNKGKGGHVPDEGKGLYCFSCGKEICRGNSIDAPRLTCPRCGASYAVFLEDGILNFVQLTDSEGNKVADEIMLTYYKEFVTRFKQMKLQRIVATHMNQEVLSNAEFSKTK